MLWPALMNRPSATPDVPVPFSSIFWVGRATGAVPSIVTGSVMVGSWVAGVLSGSLMAFNALTLTRLSHIQMLHMEFFPLALMALDELLIAPRARHAVKLALWYALQQREI